MTKRKTQVFVITDTMVSWIIKEVGGSEKRGKGKKKKVRISLKESKKTYVHNKHNKLKKER